MEPRVAVDAALLEGPRTPLARRLLFRQGYADGVKFSAPKHKEEPDYVEGYEAGRTDYVQAAEAFRQKYRLPKPDILRACG